MYSSLENLSKSYKWVQISAITKASFNLSVLYLWIHLDANLSDKLHTKIERATDPSKTTHRPQQLLSFKFGHGISNLQHWCMGQYQRYDHPRQPCSCHRVQANFSRGEGRADRRMNVLRSALFFCSNRTNSF